MKESGLTPVDVAKERAYRLLITITMLGIEKFTTYKVSFVLHQKAFSKCH
jgi:hypothetical protein